MRAPEGRIRFPLIAPGADRARAQLSDPSGRCLGRFAISHPVDQRSSPAETGEATAAEPVSGPVSPSAARFSGGAAFGLTRRHSS